MLDGKALSSQPSVFNIVGVIGIATTIPGETDGNFTTVTSVNHLHPNQAKVLLCLREANHYAFLYHGSGIHRFTVIEPL